MTSRFEQIAPRMMRDLMRDFAPLADFQAAGAVGNGGGESRGFAIAQEGKPISGRGGWGGFQWTGPRRVAYEKFLREHGRNPADPVAALDYDMMYGMLKQELQGPERATIPALRQAKDIDEATKAFMVKFERPGIPNYKGRVSWSKRALAAYVAEQGKIAHDPVIVKDRGQPTSSAPADGIPKPQPTNGGSFWTTILGGAGVGAAATYNWALEYLPLIVFVVGLIIVGIFVLRPAYLRWRDYLQHAPEVHDAPFATRLKIAFEGFKTKMLARLTTGASALAVVTSSASSLAGFDGLNIDNLLPAIPIAKDVKIVATQYIALLGVGVGYLNSYLRSISTTPEGTIDPLTAVSVAAQSDHVVGSTPTPALMAVTASPPAVAEIATPVPVKARRVSHKHKKKARR
jgi:hypothetical protein